MQPAQRVLPAPGPRRGSRGGPSTAAGLRARLRRQRDARLSHRPRRAPGHPDRRPAQPPGQRGLQRRPEGVRQEADPAGRTRRDALAEECWRQVLSSLVVCFFARGIYQPELVVRALAGGGRGPFGRRPVAHRQGHPSRRSTGSSSARGFRSTTSACPSGSSKPRRWPAAGTRRISARRWRAFATPWRDCRTAFPGRQYRLTLAQVPGLNNVRAGLERPALDLRRTI